VVDRDVADILRIRKTDALRKLIDQIAARTAEETNTTTLSRLIGVERKTIEDYMDVLMRLSMIVKLPAWTSSESKRDIKQPKYHFADTGKCKAFSWNRNQIFEHNYRGQFEDSKRLRKSWAR